MMRVYFLIICILLFLGLFPLPTAQSQPSDEYIHSLAWRPDGSQFATGQDEGIVQIWDGQTGELQHTLSITAEPDESLLVNDVQWSPDGTMIAAAATSYRRYALISVLATASGEILASFPLYNESYSVSWRPDGTQLAGSTLHGDEGYVKIWDTQTWQELTTLADVYEVSSLAWRPDGQVLAVGEYQGMIAIRDAADWDWLFYLASHRAALDLAWSSDGGLLFSRGASILVWDGSEQQVLKEFACAESEWLMDSSVSVDGSRVAAACGHTVRVWDVASGTPLQMIDDGPVPILEFVALSPDGQTLVYCDTSSHPIPTLVHLP